VANQVSFIDAAHLLSWTGFRNDRPTNGLVLCKNHHWAMDREILAPRAGSPLACVHAGGWAAVKRGEGGKGEE
jgi:hypothetical protein